MSEFDQFGHDYKLKLEQSIKGLGSVDSALRSKMQVLHKITAGQGGLRSGKTLDFGCGTGLLTDLLHCFSDTVIGAEVSRHSLGHSVSRDSHFVLFDGNRLPFQDNSFDLVVASCVFHHIPPEDRSSSISEVSRVMARGGIFVVIEHNPFNPVTRFVVNRCEFDRHAQLLSRAATGALLRQAKLQRFSEGYFYAVPPVNRALSAIDQWLAKLPLGAQYYCAYQKVSLNESAGSGGD